MIFDQLELLRDLTIIIPTCNRPLNLERAIEYWRDTPITIHIVDGSDSPAFPNGLVPGIPTITYHHLPNGDGETWKANYPRRMRFAATLPTTRYSALCADDDAFTLSGLVACVKTLNKNEDIDAIVGQTAIYRPDVPAPLWHLSDFMGGWTDPERIKSSHVEDRLSAGRGGFLYYGIIRSQRWSNLLELAFQRAYTGFTANEFLMYELGRVMCRSVALDDIFWIRQAAVYDPTAARNHTVLANNTWFKDWWHDKNNAQEVAALIEQLTRGIVCVLPDGDRSEAERLVRKLPSKSWIYETASHRRKKNLIGKPIHRILRSLPPRLKRRINSFLPARIVSPLKQTIYPGSPRRVDLLEAARERNNLEDFIISLSKTNYPFDPRDLQRFERILLCKREELRLHVLIGYEPTQV